MNFELNLKKPKGSFEIWGNDNKTDLVENVITMKGMELFSTPSYPTPLMAPNGGRIRYAMLGNGESQINKDSDSIEGDVLISDSVSASINYTTEDGLRYANINLAYTFPESEEDISFNQVGLFGTDVNENMLFGQTLSDVIYFEAGETPRLLYSIKVHIISALTEAYAGDIGTTHYTAYVKFHEEGDNTLHLLWPYDTGGNIIRSGYAARPILNNNVMGDGRARYSNKIETSEDYSSTTHNLEYIILGTEAGEVTFFLLECGNYSNTQSGYSVRIQFDRDIYKSIEHIIKLKFRIKINWS